MQIQPNAIAFGRIGIIILNTPMNVIFSPTSVLLVEAVMLRNSSNVESILRDLNLVTTSKSIAGQFEDAYNWLADSHVHLDPRETVGTLVFTSKGRQKVSHLTWSDMTSIHEAYQRLNQYEQYLATQVGDQS